MPYPVWVDMMHRARISHTAVHGHPEYVLARELHKMGILKARNGYFVLPPQDEIESLQSYITPEEATRYYDNLPNLAEAT